MVMASLAKMKKKIEEGDIDGLFELIEYESPNELNDKICTILILHAIEKNQKIATNFLLLYDFDIDAHILDNYTSKFKKTAEYATRIKEINRILNVRYLCCMVDDK